MDWLRKGAEKVASLATAADPFVGREVEIATKTIRIRKVLAEGPNAPAKRHTLPCTSPDSRTCPTLTSQTSCRMCWALMSHASSGGFGIVYCGKDVANGEEFAVKRLRVSEKGA